MKNGIDVKALIEVSKEARNIALEDAALECEKTMENYKKIGLEKPMDLAAHNCASRLAQYIRAMKS